jgi:hypothetical protein
MGKGCKRNWLRTVLNTRFDISNVEYLVGFEVLTAVIIKSAIFWDITPCRRLKVNVHFEGKYRLHFLGRRITPVLATCFTLVTCLAYYSTLKVEVTCFSETSVDFQRTARHYIPEDGTLDYLGSAMTS